jgi:hypothetical protein
MAYRYSVSAVIWLGVLVLAGCGPSSPGSKNTAATPTAAAGPHFVSGPNACDVLTDAAAKQLLGDSAKLVRKVQTNPYMSQCQYSSSNGVITVMVGDWKMIHTSSPQDKAIAGLGDEAYDTPGGVDVRKGEVGLSTNVIVSSGEFWGNAADDALAQMDAAERKVAAALLPNL